MEDYVHVPQVSRQSKLAAASSSSAKFSHLARRQGLRCPSTQRCASSVQRTPSSTRCDRTCVHDVSIRKSGAARTHACVQYHYLRCVLCFTRVDRWIFFNKRIHRLLLASTEVASYGNTWTRVCPDTLTLSLCVCMCVCFTVVARNHSPPAFVLMSRSGSTLQ